MTSNELRQKFLEFFSAKGGSAFGGNSKGHTIIPSASLIPENDPTVLFTTAGMHPLVPYLMGEDHPGGKRVANVQKCIRTVDIDEVGDTTHHTFFEMLGNWSFGDYFKKEAIEWSWEFLTSPKWLGLDKKRLAVSVFAGDEDAPRDNEAADRWLEVSGGTLKDRIDYLPKNKNWWGPAGETGPCGPDTEMFYWVGEEEPPAKINPGDLADHPKWVEIWNDVFMQYNKTEEGKYELLAQKNVDTGMGLERILAVMNGVSDGYKTELFTNIIFKIERLSGKKYGESEETTRAMRIISDHLKAATFIMGDNKGVTPSNTDQGYVVRRLIRRAIRYGRQIGITEELWTKEIAKVVAHDYGNAYPELRKNVNFFIGQLKGEEAKFKKTLEKGERHVWELLKESEKITGLVAFDTYQTYGFPPEMLIEDLRGRGIKVDEKKITEEFQKELKKHQELSRTASAGMFKGGLADAREETKRLHTAAHLLLAALRKVLGDHVVQRGSNITAERLRFDFSHPDKITEEQKKEMERLVNEAIGKNFPVKFEEMTVEEAKKEGALGAFESKYGEKVKVYTMGDENETASKEICGGPHVDHTGQLGEFKILKEESSSAGVRRIKAILE